MKEQDNVLHELQDVIVIVSPSICSYSSSSSSSPVGDPTTEDATIFHPLSDGRALKSIPNKLPSRDPISVEQTHPTTCDSSIIPVINPI